MGISRHQVKVRYCQIRLEFVITIQVGIQGGTSLSGAYTADPADGKQRDKSMHYDTPSR